jgi:hypothetical protein
MDLKNAYGMKQLMALCLNCQSPAFYSGKIVSEKNGLNGKEILFCRSCKFIVSVDEYKKILFSE